MKLKEIKNTMFGGKGTIEYIVEDYNGTKEDLEKYFEDERDFWEHYYVRERDGKFYVTRDIDSLDQEEI